MQGWAPEVAGVLLLPSGRSVRGRGLAREPAVGSLPDFGLYLLGSALPPVPWASRWVRWRDWRVPTDDQDASDALREAWRRCADERVEVACRGGHGRTGTALACLAVLDGVPADQAVAYVRRHYRRRAVETPGQERYVATFDA